MTDLRKLAEAATPGPWVVDDGRVVSLAEDDIGPRYDTVADLTGNEGMGSRTSYDYDDAAFIAACSPAAIIALLDRAERAERELAEERHLATVRGEMLTKCERERDEARNLRRMLRRMESDLLIATAKASKLLRREKEAAERERDEARAEHAKDTHDLHVAVANLLRSLDEARAERDARPEITPEDAAASVVWGANLTTSPYGPEETHVRATRAHAALRAHAAKAKVSDG